MSAPEDPIEMERRHVRQGEELVAKQIALVEGLDPSTIPEVRQQAMKVLAALRDSLQIANDRLAYLERGKL